jgi:pyruvate kinase
MLPQNKTKIVATIGPASNSVEVMKAMLQAGLNVARLNFSHADFAAHQQTIANLRAAAKAAGRPITIMADLPGPKMRIGHFGVEKIKLNTGDHFILTTEEVMGDQNRVSVSFTRLPQVVKPGNVLSLNDGYIQLEVVHVRGTEVECVVKVGGELRSRKGLNLPGLDLGISAFTARDRECLAFALAHGVEAVSQSFVECAAEIQEVRRAATDLGHNPFVIAKIERARALQNLDDILEVADGVMIARGDLGVEVPIERIALVQKDVMRRANQRAKPVITATQMLESMTSYRLPTRAEATDVSNAILDGTDAVMLSAESAMGAYPVEAVSMLARIAGAVEPARRRVTVREMYSDVDLTGRVRPQHLIAVSVEASLELLERAAVFSSTQDGQSARWLSTFRLPVWIAAASANAKTCQDLAFSYGVVPLHLPDQPGRSDDYAKDWVRASQLPGDFLIHTQRRLEDHGAGDYRMDIIRL